MRDKCEEDAERVNPVDARASRNEEMRERIPENPANRLHNDPLREMSGKLYSAERRPARALRASCDESLEESKERGILAAKGKGILRYRGASCLVQNCENFSEDADTRYAVHDVRTAFTSSGWKADTWPGLLSTTRESCASNSALLAKDVDNVSREIIISHRITREKIYFVRVRMCARVYVCMCDAPRVISVIESTDD